MGLKEELEQEYKTALKAGEKLKVSTLRMLKAALRNKEIEEGRGLTTQEELRVVQMLVKQREESIEAYRAGGRQDLADQEAEEAKILEAYLPQQLSEEQLERLVRDVLEEHGATSLKEAQPLTRLVLERAEGRAEGKRVQQVLQRLFS
ncbi:MAG: GatB/YqeY domain-containing protein [Nitrospirota bacterium]|nr:GatB/YqeY domain-containing protein [Nitrospirota bacterium]